MNANLKTWLQIGGVLLLLFAAGLVAFALARRTAIHPVRGNSPAAAVRPAAG